MPPKRAHRKKMIRRTAKYVFLDVEKFTQLNRNADDQVMIIDALGKIVRDTLDKLEIPIEEAERSLLLPTGDGVCICLLGEGAFDEHMQVALLVLKKLKTYNGRQRRPELKFQVRIGINAHTDVHMKDIRGNWNMAGRGISDAQRVMDAGDGGNVIVSEIVYKTLIDSNVYLKSTINFKHSAVRDKHGNLRDVYQYIDSRAVGLNNDEARPRKDEAETAVRNGEALFWLGHDLRWTRSQLTEGASKERILKGLKQMLVHFTSSGLPIAGMQERLVSLKRDTEHLPDPNWSEKYREGLSVKVDQVIDDVDRWFKDGPRIEETAKAVGDDSMSERLDPVLFGWTMHHDQTMPSDILGEARGVFSIWAKVTDDHNKILDRRPRSQYIAAHATNSGRSLGNSAFAKYPNAWAIRRVTPYDAAKTGSWVFWCNGMEPQRLEMKCEVKLHPGWHMFTVEWSSDRNFIRFFIDAEPIGQDEFKLWPKGLSGSITLGTWVHDNPGHRLNSEVGPCYTTARTLEDGELKLLFSAGPSK